jgi:hypothetical protein
MEQGGSMRLFVLLDIFEFSDMMILKLKFSIHAFADLGAGAGQTLANGRTGGIQSIGGFIEGISVEIHAIDRIFQMAAKKSDTVT